MLELKNLTKVYKPKKGQPVTALDNVSIKFEETGMVFVLGKSGSGKSTLLNLMGGLDSATDGDIIIKGKSSRDFNQGDFDSYRNTYLGFIFQEYNILNEFTVGQNIALALELQGRKNDKEAVEQILREVDLEGYATRKPHELSGGQMQRVAIARALIKSPDIIMADEPTGALDSNTGRQVFEALQKLSADKLVIIVSHDREYAEYYGDRVIEFRDGKVISDIRKYKIESKTFAGGGVTMTEDNSIIQIKKGHILTAQEKEQILRVMDAPQKDIILSSDTRGNAELLKSARVDADGNRESFKNTSDADMALKQYSAKDFHLKKSRLPSRHAMRIGASGLRVKPIRLIFTILLSAVAFTMFGLADTAGSYDKYTATLNSLRDSNITTIALTKNGRIPDDVNEYGGYYSPNMGFTQADFTVFQNKLPGITVSSIHGAGNPYMIQSLGSAVLQTYYATAFRGYIETNRAKLNDLGFTFQGTLPAAANEIAISKYVAESFITAGYIDNITNDVIEINSAEGILGKTIMVYHNAYIVTAVIDTKLDSARYEPLKNSGGIDMGDLGGYMLFSEFNNVISYSYHGAMFVGNTYIEAEDNYSAQTQFVLLSLPSDKAKAIELIKFAYDFTRLNSEEDYFYASGYHGSFEISYDMQTAVSSMLNMVNSMLESMAGVFLYIGIGFAVFAALMFFNFISVSIAYKKKEIGILRAIGARSSDVFRIFFWESIFITVLNTILAVIGTAFGVTSINSAIRGQGILITVLNLGIRQVLLIAAVGLLTAFISTLLPVWRIARKKPVDAIKK